MSKPFSYFLYHKPTGLKYYGIRHGRNSHPNQLWTTYFSSSKIVKQLIADYGLDSFEYEIRKTFKTSSQALLWEHKVLRRLNAANSDQWINRHNGGNKFRAPITHSEETRKLLSKKFKGRVLSADHKKKISEASLKDRERRRQRGWTMPREAIEKMLETRKGLYDKCYSSERNAKMAASKKGTKRQYLPDGSFIMVRVQQDQ